MKSVCIKLKDNKYEDYLFVIYINQINILSEFLIFKFNSEKEKYEMISKGEFRDEELDFFINSFYQSNNYTVCNELHPSYYLINKNKNEKAEYQYKSFVESNFLKSKSSKYNLLFCGEAFHELFFLIRHNDNKNCFLLRTDPFEESLTFIANPTQLNNIEIEKLAVMISLIIPRIPEKDYNFIVHLSDNIEVMLYKEDNKGYVFIVTKSENGEEYNIRYLFYDLPSQNKAEILYQTDINQNLLYKLRLNAKDILLKSKYEFLLDI